MNDEMFCYQCEEALNGIGCTKVGVCGKSAELSCRLDLLLFMVRGLCTVADTLRRHEMVVDGRVNHAVVESLFASMTNVNFDDLDIERRAVTCMELRYELSQQAQMEHVHLPDVDEVNWFGLPIDFYEKGLSVGILRESSAEIRGYKEFILYGLKGMSAYLYHAMNLGYDSPEIHVFIQHTIAMMTLERRTPPDWQKVMLRTGEMGLRVISLLDKAHNARLGPPEAGSANCKVRRRPGILVSGHDMGDIWQLLSQCENSGVDVYTHCEMLPAHFYPELKKFKCLFGHYGGSWWQQHAEFSSFNGPILMTSNCLVPLYIKEGYQNRFYTTGVTGYPASRYIAVDSHNKKDFTQIIQQALECEPPSPLADSQKLTGGYGHQQLTRNMEQILRLLSENKITRFAVIAGCDGRLNYRRYYTELAKRLPQSVVILTGGCAKFRVNRVGLGCIGSLPRVLDMGQCNDLYSLVVFAGMLKDALGVASLNQLPITYYMAWYEQKSVIVLLALLSLGVRHIFLGPTWPAFVTEDMRFILREKFELLEIVSADEDVHAVFHEMSEM